MLSVFDMLDSGAVFVLETNPVNGSAPERASVPMMRNRASDKPLVGDVSQYEVTFTVSTKALGTFPKPRKGFRIIAEDEIFTLNSNPQPLYDDHGNVGAYRMRCTGH